MADTVGNLLVKIGADVSGLSQASTETTAILRRIDQSARASAGGFSAFGAAVVTANQGLQLLSTGASAVSGIGQAFFAQADAASQLAAQIRLVTGSQEEALAVQQQLLGVANTTRTGLAETATLYSRLARNSGELGVSQQDLLRVTQTINESLVISGASTAEAASGMLQLSQALGAGALRGDELNSVLESMPTVAGILASALNVPIGKLKDLAQTGAITSKVVVGALLGASNQVDSAFAKIPITAAQAFTVLKNEALNAVGEIDRATGATAALVKGIDNVKNAAIAFVPPLVQGLKSAGDSASQLATSIGENRSAVFNEMAIAAGALGAALLGAALQSTKFATAVSTISTLGAAISPVTLVIAGVAAVAGLAIGNFADWNRETQKAAEAQGTLAGALARAKSRGVELTESQKQAILGGKDLKTVLDGTAASLTSMGTAAQQTAGKLNAVGEAISKAVQKAQTDVAIFGTAVGSMATSTSTAFKDMAAGIATATGSIPAVPSDSFVTLTQNINRSALAMTSLGAQSATLISQMQTLDTSTAIGAASFAKLDEQLAEVRKNENIVFKADFGDLTSGLKSIQDAIKAGVDPVQIKTDAESLRAMGEAIKAQVKATNDQGLIADISLAVDKFNKQLDTTLKGADASIETFYDRLRAKPPVGVKLTPQFELQQFVAELDAVRSRIVGTPDGELKMELKAHAEELEKKIAETRAKIKEGETMPVDADTSKADAKVEKLKQDVATITLGFGKITGEVATGADMQNTIERLRSDLIAAVKAGDEAAQDRLRGSALQFLQGTAGITREERKSILDIVGPFASIGRAQSIQAIGAGGLLTQFAGTALARPLEALTAKQAEQLRATQENTTKSSSSFAVMATKQDEGNRISDKTATAAIETAVAAQRTAKATEDMAKSLSSGRFGGFVTNEVNQNLQRTTGVRGGGLA